MKIAVFHNLPSGGAKRAVHEICKILSKRHVLHLFRLTTSCEDFLNIENMVERVFTFDYKEDEPFKSLNPLKRFINLYKLYNVSQKIAKEIDRGPYDFVFIHACKFTQTPLIIRFLKKPSVYFCNEPIRLLYEYKHYFRETTLKGNTIKALGGIWRWYLKNLEFKNIQKAKLVLCNSYYTREYLYRLYGIFAEVNYLGVDVDFFRPLDVKKEDLILSVGALFPIKAHDFIIKSLSLLPKEFKFKLGIVYDMEMKGEREFLERIAKENKIEIEFYKNISDKELVELYNKAKITVYAPIMEPFGLVPLESMACETPVVGVKEGGVRESIIDKKTGLLTDRDVKKFSEAILLLLSNRELRREMGKNGREHVLKNWSWQRSVENIENNFLKIL